MPVRTGDWKSQFGSIRAFMQQAIRAEMSFSDFQRVAIDTGISYRRSRMLIDWREVAGLYKWEVPISRLRPDTPIPDYMSTRGWPGQKANYLVGVEFTYTEYLTGDDKTGIRMISSSESFGHEVYEKAASRSYEPNRAYADPTARDFRVAFVYRKRGT